MRTTILFGLFLAGCDGGEIVPPILGETVLGAHCELDQRVALVQVQRSDGASSASFSTQVFDAADPWIGPPTLADDHCAHHSFDPGSCGTCDDGMTCGFGGACVPERRAVSDATLSVTVGGETTEHTAVEQGLIFGTIEGAGPVALTLRWSGQEAGLPETAVAGDLVAGVTATGDYDDPGDLDVSWTDPGEGGFVGTRIPINHHAGGPTFTDCRAPADEEGFVVPSAMVQPLAVSTGLEFQGLEHYAVAATRNEEGCVEFRLGTWVYSDVQYPR